MAAMVAVAPIRITALGNTKYVQYSVPAATAFFRDTQVRHVKERGTMIDDDDDEAKLPFLVVANNEEQHSLWRADLTIPSGWRSVFGPAGKSDCLSYVSQNWTDMRPLSLRRAMKAANRTAEPD
jgi:MbtH protein